MRPPANNRHAIIEELQRQCRSTISLNSGEKVLEALLNRKEDYYFEKESSFEKNDFPVKIQPVSRHSLDISLVDVIQDINTFDRDKGTAVANILQTYSMKASGETNSFCIPLQPESVVRSRLNSDIKTLNPERVLREQAFYDENGWEMTLNFPRHNPIHYESVIAGQIIVHLRGRQLWIFGPSDKENMNLWAAQEQDPKSTHLDQTVNFVSKSSRMLVYLAHEPCVILVPPHYFSSVLTFEPSAQLGIPVVSFFWLKEMTNVMKQIKPFSSLARDDEYPRQIWKRDCTLLYKWITWVEDNQVITTVMRDKVEFANALVQVANKGSEGDSSLNSTERTEQVASSQLPRWRWRLVWEGQTLLVCP